MNTRIALSTALGLSIVTAAASASAYTTFPAWHLGVSNGGDCINYDIVTSWAPCNSSILQAVQYNAYSSVPAVIHAWDNSCLDWIDMTAYGRTYNQLEFNSCGLSSWNWKTPSWTQDSLGELHDTSSGECMANYPASQTNGYSEVPEGICGLWGGYAQEDMVPIEQSVDPSLMYAYFPVISQDLVVGVGGTVQWGAPISIMEAIGSAPQRWGQWNDGAIVLYDYPDMCMTAASATNGAEVYLAPCGSGEVNQTWVPVYPHQMVLAGTEMCLDVPYISLTPGTNLDVWQCNGGLNQQFNAPPHLSYF